MIMTEKQKGIICIIASAFCFATMTLFAKLSGNLPSIQKAFFRNILAGGAAIIILARSNTKFSIKKKNLPFFILRSLFGTIGIVANFYAVEHLFLADASILAKLAPFFAMLFSAFFLKEKIKPYEAFAVAAAFITSLLIIKPTFAANTHVIAALIAAIGGMAAGAAYTNVRYLMTHQEHAPCIILFFSFFSCIVLLPFFILFFKPMTISQILLLISSGVFGAGGQFAVTAAYSHVPAKSISVFDYTQILFSAMYGLILFKEIPDIYSIIGYILICALSVWTFLHNEKE